jgi:hypothetical protein
MYKRRLAPKGILELEGHSLGACSPKVRGGPLEQVLPNDKQTNFFYSIDRMKGPSNDV